MSTVVKAWRLMPSFQIREVEGRYTGAHSFETMTRQWISRDRIFPTREAAIEAGHRRLDTDHAGILRRQAMLAKRRDNLKKAAQQ